MQPQLDQILQINEKDLFTCTEAAKLFGVTRMAVQQWIRRGGIKAAKVGGKYYIAGRDLKAKVTLSVDTFDM